MSRYMYIVAAVLVASCVPFASFALNPAGTRPATAADLPTMRAAGIPNPTVGMLWNPNDPHVGQAAGATKQWLQQHATKDTNISCMSPEFAEKLKKFMEAVPGGPPTVTSGYRGQAEQQRALANGASKVGWCGSYHNYGLAADFNNNNRSQTAWMRANARAYGMNILGAWDPNHFQDSGGIRGQCGGCSNETGDGSLPSAAGGSANQNFIDSLRKLLSPTQPPAPPAAPQAQTQSPAATQPTAAYTPNTSTTVEATTSKAISSSDTVAGQAATSTYISIDEMASDANPTSTDVATTTPIVLNPDVMSEETRSYLSSPAANGTSQTVVYVNTEITPQATFTSGDLSDTYAPGTVPTNNLALLLSALQGSLSQLMRLITPFSDLSVPHQTEFQGTYE